MRKAGQLDVAPDDAPAGAPHPVAALLRRAVVEADRYIYEAAHGQPRAGRAWGRR